MYQYATYCKGQNDRTRGSSSTAGVQSCLQGTRELLHASYPLVVKGKGRYDCTKLKAVGTNQILPQAASLCYHCTRQNSDKGNEVKNVTSIPCLMLSSIKLTGLSYL
jgi:hypothetical protein